MGKTKSPNKPTIEPPIEPARSMTTYVPNSVWPTTENTDATMWATSGAALSAGIPPGDSIKSALPILHPPLKPVPMKRLHCAPPMKRHRQDHGQS